MDDRDRRLVTLNWPSLFAEEAARLRAVLPADLILGLEHFGSTAIPGLAAKPIIDILIAVRSLAEARGIRSSRWSGSATSSGPTIRRPTACSSSKACRLWRGPHASCPYRGAGCEPWQRLIFRDHLRTHPAEADCADETLKRDLAARYRDDREGPIRLPRKAMSRSVMAKARRAKGIDP